MKYGKVLPITIPSSHFTSGVCSGKKGSYTRLRGGGAFHPPVNHFFCTHSGEGSDLVGGPGREVSAKN